MIIWQIAITTLYVLALVAMVVMRRRDKWYAPYDHWIILSWIAWLLFVWLPPHRLSWLFVVAGAIFGWRWGVREWAAHKARRRPS
jgi:hypothetical protein